MSSRPSELTPSWWEMFTVWARLSVLSFGGGVATLGLIKQECVDRRKWLTEEQFLRDWSLCQLAPGINLIALTILIGRRMGGGASVAAAVFGLLLPSGAVTISATGLYAHFAHSPFIAAARLGIVPAVAGVGLATVWSMAAPIVKRNRQEGVGPTVFAFALVSASFCAEKMLKMSPALVVLAAGGLGMLGHLVKRKIQPGSPVQVTDGGEL